ncbi:MAG: exopolysaccharide biosynthesis polyprenyl glycosylphosphotransferase [Puniceicoccaceae bacterium]
MKQQRVDWIESGKTLEILDLLVGFFAVCLAYAVNPDLNLSWAASFRGQPGAFPLAIIFGLCLMFTGKVIGLYDPIRLQRWEWLFARAFFAASVALAGTFFITYLFFLESPGRWVAFCLLSVATVGIGATRLLFCRLAAKRPRRLLLLLECSMIEAVQERIAAVKIPLKIVGEAEVPRLRESAEGLAQFVREHEVDEVVVPWIASQNVLDAPWVKALYEGVQITHYPAFLERYFQKVELSHLGANWLCELDLRLTHPVYHRWKRLLDIGLAVVGVIMSAPLVAAVACLIWIESGRPVFFRQERVGLRGATFLIWKLRTMRLAEDHHAPVLTQAKDPRVTRLGKLLRRTRFDETPQFINILRGEMSFIGPRPDWVEVARFCEGKIPIYRFRTLVKPGLTGWAQINYRYAETEKDILEKLSYDFYYMRNASAMLDLQIVMRTFGALTKGGR